MTGEGTDEISFTFAAGPIREQHIRDAKNAEDCPEDLNFEEQSEKIVASGSRESIRWLFDYLHDLTRAWRMEGEQWDAKVAEEMAEMLWASVDIDDIYPQRRRRITDGGHADRRDLEDDPRACSVCGVHIGFGGDDYCDGCAREIGAKPPLRRCEHCGTRGPEEYMKPIDISTEDEYYPEFIYICRGCANGGESGD